MKKPKLSLARETERILTAYDYPGNVRELKNLIERAVILSSGETIGRESIVCPALRATGWSPTISFPLSSMNQDNRRPSIVWKLFTSRSSWHSPRETAPRLPGCSAFLSDNRKENHGLRLAKDKG